MLRSFWIYLILIFCGFVSQPISAKEVQHKDAEGRDFWVYTPDTIDPDKTYTLVLGVHGYRGNGKGAGGYARWANEHDVIVLGPTFDSNGYQYLQKGSDQQALDLIKALHSQYKLNKKIFVVGFSGGAQFAHRFAMKYPDLVAGCAAHSGGTWATGDYAERAVPNPKAKGVLFVISCGESDTKKSFGQAPMGRLEWAKKYAAMLKDGGFIYEAQWWPGVGHHLSKGARQMTKDCFIASTRLIPELADEMKRIDQLLDKKDYNGAWLMIKKRQEQASQNRSSIVGQTLHHYVESLAAPIGKIDRWAEREVRKAVRVEATADSRRDTLERLKTKYDGLPRTMKTIASALAGLE